MARYSRDAGVRASRNCHAISVSILFVDVCGILRSPKRRDGCDGGCHGWRIVIKLQSSCCQSRGGVLMLKATPRNRNFGRGRTNYEKDYQLSFHEVPMDIMTYLRNGIVFSVGSDP